jgi:hypothetical protein
MAKKLSISTLNRLNEEDESAMSSTLSEANLINPLANELTTSSISDNINLHQEQEKLKSTIDLVFQSLPPCEQPMDLDTASKRYEFLEQLLIDRLVYGEVSNKPVKRTNLPITITTNVSAAAYSSMLTSTYLSNQTCPIENDSQSHEQSTHATKVLLLNNLKLTSECLRLFSPGNIIGRQNHKLSSDESQSSNV